MTFTPADLRAAADREADITRIVPYRPDMTTAEKIEALTNRAAWLEAHYGCRPGDGGTADQLRAGADAMAECERLRAALARLGGGEAFTLPFYIADNKEGRELQARMRFADATLQGDPK